MKRSGGPQSFGPVSEFILCFWPTTVISEELNWAQMKLANRHVANKKRENIYGSNREKVGDNIKQVDTCLMFK